MQAPRPTAVLSVVKATVFAGAFLALSFLSSFVKNLVPTLDGRLVHGLTGTLAALLCTAVFLKIDRKPFAAIGLRFEGKTLLRFLLGVLIGVALMGTLAAAVFFFTAATVQANPTATPFGFFLATAPLLPLALMEELAFRAYPLRLLNKTLGIWPALFVTTLLFALSHLAYGWTVEQSFFGPGIWGLVFGLAALRSGGIALSTGLHYAANLTTFAFGAGNNVDAIWNIRQPAAATNTARGVDWTVVGPSLALLLVAVGCIEWYARRRPAVAEAANAEAM